jgi:hypothetical protein
LNEFELFLKGYKPALIYNPNANIIAPGIETIHAKFPHLTIHQEYMYFQNRKLRSAFKKAIKGLEFGSIEFQRVLGLALGFPPVAVEYFLAMIQNPELEEKRAYVNHHGLTFICNIDDIEEVATWLYSNICPGATVFEYQDKEFILDIKEKRLS